MTIRIWRILLGLSLLLALYFDMRFMIWGIIGILFFEGLANLRIVSLLNSLLGHNIENNNTGCLGIKFEATIGFEAERALSLIISSLLFITYVLYFDQVWFFPWFIAFAIIGAGVSGVCPMFLFLKWLGFK